MILHTIFVVDTSLSMQPIFEALVDEVLCPLAKGLQARATQGCGFRFSLHTFPEGGQMLADGDAAALEQALNHAVLTGGAADGREALGPTFGHLWEGLAPADDQVFYALCVVSDTVGFSGALNDIVVFTAPETLTATVLLWHPACKTGLLPVQGSMPVSAAQWQYSLDDGLPALLPEIIRKLSDTVLENSNLR